MKEWIRKIIPKPFLLLYHRTVVFLAAAYYGFPSDKMIVIGVTGTKGKTSTTNFIADILEGAGYKVGVLSTAQYRLPGKKWTNESKMTMPGRAKLQKFLRRAQKSECKYVVIETSSEGIAQQRMTAISYDVAVFLNISPEHIESHGSFEKYQAAKEKLFKSLAKSKHKPNVPKISIVNLDDEKAQDFLKYDADKKYGFTRHGRPALENMKSVAASNIHYEGKRVVFDLHVDGLQDKVEAPIPGLFNAENILAAISVALSQDIRWEKVQQGIKNLKSVPGRLEFVDEGQPYKVIIDYAHEPKSLEAVLREARELSDGKVLVLTGSQGGGRDKQKRPKIGSVAHKYADFVVVTNEDPYDEDPATIIQEVAEGIEDAGGDEDDDYIAVPARRDAIQKTLDRAQTGDVVVLAGKGSETVMAVAHDKKVPWSDREAVTEILKNLPSK
ncbi:Mur ligase family protein [Patescibacteria group bacterium]